MCARRTSSGRANRRLAYDLWHRSNDGRARDHRRQYARFGCPLYKALHTAFRGLNCKARLEAGQDYNPRQVKFMLSFTHLTIPYSILPQVIATNLVPVHCRTRHSTSSRAGSRAATTFIFLRSRISFAILLFHAGSSAAAQVAQPSSYALFPCGARVCTMISSFLRGRVRRRIYSRAPSWA